MVCCAHPIWFVSAYHGSDPARVFGTLSSACWAFCVRHIIHWITELFVRCVLVRKPCLLFFFACILIHYFDISWCSILNVRKLQKLLLDNLPFQYNESYHRFDNRMYLNGKRLVCPKIHAKVFPKARQTEGRSAKSRYLNARTVPLPKCKIELCSVSFILIRTNSVQSCVGFLCPAICAEQTVSFVSVSCVIKGFVAVTVYTKQ